MDVTGNPVAVTYGDASVLVANLIDRLRSRGVEPGDRVACYVEDTVPLVFFTLAAALSRVVPVPISPIFSGRFLRDEIVRRVDAKLVFTTPALCDVVEREGLAVMTDASPLEAGEPRSSEPPQLSRERAKALLLQCHDGDPDSLFAIQPTSGSTGYPKLVLRKPRALMRYAENLARRLARDDDEQHRILLVAALTHAFGMHVFATALKLGAEICVPRGVDKDAFIEDIDLLDPTIYPLIPRVQRAFFKRHNAAVEAGTRERFFGASAQYVLSAGGPSEPGLVDWICSEGVEFVEFYGSSEASLVALTPAAGWKAGHAGVLVDDVETKLADDGELLVRSPGLFLGYLQNETLTRQATTDDGYYRTGDFAEIADDGYLRILGRKRDLFCSAEGSYVYPERIELLLEALPWVQQALLVGDGRPYLTALIACQGAPAGEVDGYLDPDAHKELYARAGQGLRALNESLEKVERIVRFSLFSGPFPADVYGQVGASKIRRDRKALASRYQARIAYLYGPTTLRDPTFVPDADRRLRSSSRAQADAARSPASGPAPARSRDDPGPQDASASAADEEAFHDKVASRR